MIPDSIGTNSPDSQLVSLVRPNRGPLTDGAGLQQDGEGFAHAMEALSDHTRQHEDLTVCVPVKRTLTTGTLVSSGWISVLVRRRGSRIVASGLARLASSVKLICYDASTDTLTPLTLTPCSQGPWLDLHQLAA